jgi:hypothetical protein
MREPLDTIPFRTNFWLLKLVPPVRHGRWLAAAAIFTLVLAPYLVIGDPSREAPPDGVDLNVALFFATLFAYIVPVHHLIMQRSLTALDQLRPQLAQDPELVSAYANRILSKPRWWQLSTLAAGLVAGTLHNLLILGEDGVSVAPLLPGSLLNVLTTAVLWIVMTATITSLIENAVRFKRLTALVAFDVLDARSLTPFGSVAVSSTLALIGAQAAFPLLIIGSETGWISFAPGLVATGVPMIIIFLLPVIPMHQRIMAAKQKALSRVAEDLAPLSASARPDYSALQPLLTYRREVVDAPEWPFDTSVIGRLAIYLIIPPLTWIGAALIEILVDTAI